jgi:hypothetical protein
MAPAHVPTVAKEQERVSFKDLADSLLGAMTATQEALAHPAADASAKPAVAERLVLESAAPALTEPVVAPLELETALQALNETAPVAATPVLEENDARPVEKVTAEPALTLEPVPATPVGPERPAAETAKPAAPAVPQGFEGLKFPNDGVLTRQWMEFLSQMSTTK